MAAPVSKNPLVIYTYMGRLQPRLGNANYCSAGQLSPLLNDPLYKTIGIGTRIFLGGGQGYVAWNGTQHNPNVKRGDNGVPRMGAGTMAVIGDLKQMSPQWLRGASMAGYGVTLTVGIGVPIPMLSEEIAQHAAVRDEEIFAQVVDYSKNYPEVIPGSVAEVSYAQLKTGSITLDGKQVPTGALSSYVKAQEIAETLKSWIQKKQFYLSEPVQLLPSVDSGVSIKLMADRPVKN